VSNGPACRSFLALCKCFSGALPNFHQMKMNAVYEVKSSWRQTYCSCWHAATLLYSDSASPKAGNGRRAMLTILLLSRSAVNQQLQLLYGGLHENIVYSVARNYVANFIMSCFEVWLIVDLYLLVVFTHSFFMLICITPLQREGYDLVEGWLDGWISR